MNTPDLKENNLFDCCWNGVNFFGHTGNERPHALSGADALTFKIDAFLVFFIAALAVIVLIDMVVKFYRYLSGRVEVIKKEIDFR
ncbi:MAG: hypothetical protein MUO31_10210, partial [Thermodesulfovibrionales bacterium]|nr:hypothetical protein [Thermodesulfovibrionales bacterium]